jgi:hypothetical protein
MPLDKRSVESTESSRGRREKRNKSENIAWGVKANTRLGLRRWLMHEGKFLSLPLF